MSLAIGTLALALSMGAISSVYAQDQQNNQPTNPPASSGAGAQDQRNGGMNGSDTGRRSSRRSRMRDSSMRGPDMSASDMERESSIRWSDRYRLTPLDHKRLRAMGLGDNEVFAVANAAHQSGVDVDEIAQMVLRGRDYFQIAEQLGIPYDSLMRRRPEWQTAEWEQGVREGWFSHRQGMSSSGMSSDHQPNR
jgi:hypothetical protein